MQRNKLLLIALLFPILALLIVVCIRQYHWNYGREVTLPILAYDPRDLLSGNYLTYQIAYGKKVKCPPSSQQIVAYVCLDNKILSFDRPSDCKLFIRGTCTGNRFIAGIERYYIPEKYTTPLAKKIQNKKASILIAVMPSGEAQVKDFLINGVSWKEIILNKN